MNLWCKEMESERKWSGTGKSMGKIIGCTGNVN